MAKFIGPRLDPVERAPVRIQPSEGAVEQAIESNDDSLVVPPFKYVDYKEFESKFCQVAFYNGVLGKVCDVNAILGQIQDNVSAKCVVSHPKDQFDCAQARMDGFKQTILWSHLTRSPDYSVDILKDFESTAARLVGQDDKHLRELNLLRLEIQTRTRIVESRQGQVTADDIKEIDMLFKKAVALNSKEPIPSHYFIEIAKLYMNFHFKLFSGIVEHNIKPRRLKVYLSRAIQKTIQCVQIFKASQHADKELLARLNHAVEQYEAYVAEAEMSLRTRPLRKTVLRQTSFVREVMQA